MTPLLGMTPFAAALTVSVPEGVAPLLDHLGDALVDLLVGRMEGLHLGHRLLALAATGTSGRIGTVKCLTSICEASIE